jgi:hypothetical protein
MVDFKTSHLLSAKLHAQQSEKAAHELGLVEGTTVAVIEMFQARNLPLHLGMNVVQSLAVSMVVNLEDRANQLGGREVLLTFIKNLLNDYEEALRQMEKK